MTYRPADVLRRRFSLGLGLLGLAIPPLVMVYLKMRYPEKVDLVAWTFGIIHQWLPFTVLLWLGAAYAWPDSRWRVVGWLVCVLGLLASLVWYVLLLRLMQ
jgi:hypothetical protein